MSLSDDLTISLRAGLDQLDCSLDAYQQKQLLDFVALLDKWNKAYNLTAVREPAQMIGQR